MIIVSYELKGMINLTRYLSLKHTNTHIHTHTPTHTSSSLQKLAIQWEKLKISIYYGKDMVRECTGHYKNPEERHLA